MVSNKNGDCFAYDKTFKKCKALNELYCKTEVCEFYKTKKQFTKENTSYGCNGGGCRD